MAAGNDWDRLAEFVRERRVELGMTQEDARAAGGPSTATMRLIEGALQQSYQPATLRDLERVLRWERGSVARILAGGEPGMLSGRPAPRPVPVMEFGEEDLPDDEYSPGERAALQDYAAEFQLKLRRARRRYPVERLTGQMVFPRDPLYQEMWDALSSLGWKPEGLPRAMAAMMVDRDEQSAGGTGTGHAAGLTAVKATLPANQSRNRDELRCNGRKSVAGGTVSTSRRTGTPMRLGSLPGCQHGQYECRGSGARKQAPGRVEHD